MTIMIPVPVWFICDDETVNAKLHGVLETGE